jgi:hypothetical protein
MFAIVLEKVQCQVGNGPNGMRLLQFVDTQSGITVTIPMEPGVARQIGLQLSTTLAVATGPIPPPSGVLGTGNGRKA